MGALLLVLVTQFGCGAIQKPSWNKPWGKGALIPALACGLAGAGVGVWIQDERVGDSTLVISNPGEPPYIIHREDDPEYWKGAVIGFPAGAVLCGILGHVFLDPGAPPPPPPPAPVPVGIGVEAEGIAVKARKRIVLRGVNFDFDLAEIRPDSAPVLDEAALLLVDMRDEIEQLVVEGHTDWIGSDEYNQALSIRRAEAVYRYLVNRGVPPELVTIEGYGEAMPVADNETEEGRAQNRRVELKVIHVKIIRLPAEGAVSVDDLPTDSESAPEDQGPDLEPADGEPAPIEVETTEPPVN